MVTPIYVDYSIFGQLPSRNYRFNVMPGDSVIPATPYFAGGYYLQYYCLLSDNSIYKGTPVLVD